jgi:hypothetical protein
MEKRNKECSKVKPSPDPLLAAHFLGTWHSVSRAVSPSISWATVQKTELLANLGPPWESRMGWHLRRDRLWSLPRHCPSGQSWLKVAAGSNRQEECNSEFPRQTDSISPCLEKTGHKERTLVKSPQWTIPQRGAKPKSLDPNLKRKPHWLPLVGKTLCFRGG